MTYAERVYESVKANNPNEPEFLQAVKEVLESLAPVFEKKPEYEAAGLLERLVEPERQITVSYTHLDTLCSALDKVVLEPVAFGTPCVSLAVSAKKQGEEDKVIAGLRRMEEEDPTFTVSKNVETGDMLVSGMGELHIEAICNKLKNKFGVEAELREPKVAYRETIRKAAEAEGRHKKQSGGAGQFGVVSIRFEPTSDGSMRCV